MSEGVLSAIGNTPLVRLTKLFPESDVRLYAKLESLNPGGSIKDRPAVRILEAAIENGSLAPGGVVVESSSGNMGIGLAQACRYMGFRFICVVDAKASIQNLRIIEAFGAEVQMVDGPDPETGELLQARLNRVKMILAENPGSFWPNQYANVCNPESHYATTMHEVAESLGGAVDYVFVATSTCGTIRGCADYCQDHGLDTRIIAVDARGSLIFSDEKAERAIPGIGAGLRPPHCRPEQIDDVLHVTDGDCVWGCRQLMDREAIFAGGSSGGVVAAVARYLDQIPTGSVCVVILPDRGERYLDTVYSDEWVRNQVGEGALHSPAPPPAALVGGTV